MTLIRLVNAVGVEIASYESTETGNTYEVLDSMTEELWGELQLFCSRDPLIRFVFEHNGVEIKSEDRLLDLAPDVVNITVLLKDPVLGVQATHLSTELAVNSERDFVFSEDGTRLQTFENGVVKNHCITRPVHADDSYTQYYNTRPGTKFVASIINESVLEIKMRTGELIGYESFPGFRIFAHAFDDQGGYGAVLARDTRNERNVVIVFRELLPAEG